MTTLLPCPFVWCGQPAVLVDELQSSRGTPCEFAAGCRDCDIYTPQCATAEEAIALWNTRTPSTETDDVRNAALEEAAKVADELWLNDRPVSPKFHEIAKAIRSLKSINGRDGG